jgi:hypothetical protein
MTIRIAEIDKQRVADPVPARAAIDHVIEAKTTCCVANVDQVMNVGNGISKVVQTGP